MTHPTDAAIAQAFREEPAARHFTAQEWRFLVKERAKQIDISRELDAAKGGDISNSVIRDFRNTDLATPPAQAAEAVAESAFRRGKIGVYHGWTFPAKADNSTDADTVERVVLAMLEVERPDRSHAIVAYWNCLSEDVRRMRRRMARAAIAAMQAGEGV